MSGFVVETTGFSAEDRGLRLVDLGQCEMVATRCLRSTRAAWARWPDSRHLMVLETSSRLLFIEGQPDRLPYANEPLERWLDGRGGSFRGFQIECRSSSPDRITVFVDPMGTRPVFIFVDGSLVRFADKLATIAANSPSLECDWGALMECAILAVTTLAPSTLRNVEMLAPGEVIEIEGTRISNRRRPVVLDTGARPAKDASQRLEKAIRTAVEETWTDPEARLLLSGGLDSRMILGLSPAASPKTATVDIYPEETLISRQVATARGADFRVLPFPVEHYCTVMEKGYLITGGMHQSNSVAFLGLACEWRKSGIPAIVHGYFHNTIFRGWAAERWQKYPDLDLVLTPYLGPKAHYFDDFPHNRTLVQETIDLLSDDGRHLLKRQLSALAAQLEIVIVDGFDLTHERLMMRDVARQVNFAVFYGWMEEIDVISPVFHPASWHWYATTHPADRHRDVAVRQLYHNMAYGLAEISDLHGKGPVRPLSRDWREPLRNQFWLPLARSIKRKLFPSRPPHQTHTPIDYDAIYRQPPVVEALCLGVEALRDNPLFDRASLDEALAAYLGGANRPAHSLWTVASAGQWHNFVRNGGAGEPAVRELIPAGRADSASFAPVP